MATLGEEAVAANFRPKKKKLSGTIGSMAGQDPKTVQIAHAMRYLNGLRAVQEKTGNYGMQISKAEHEALMELDPRIFSRDNIFKEYNLSVEW